MKELRSGLSRSFLLLMKTTPFCILSKAPREGILWSLLLALPFGTVIILIDLLAPFPKDIALPFPVSLLIYPAMGFVAEIIFQLGPSTGRIPYTSLQPVSAHAVQAM